MPMTVVPPATPRADWRAFTWRVPDWWLGTASLAAWIGLAAMLLAPAAGHSHAGHGAGRRSPRGLRWSSR